MRFEPDQFLLELYRLTGSGPSGAFSAAVFQLLAETLGVDSGLWSTFTLAENGPCPHSLYLHNLPARMTHEYEDVKQHDILNQQAVAQCGRTFNISLAQVEGTAHPLMLAHARRWDMEHALATMIFESPLNLYTAFCVYRGAAKHPFSERQRTVTERIVPHLVQAWHLNELRYLDAPPTPAPGVAHGRALIDRLGVLHKAEPVVPGLFRREVSQWEGPSIPTNVLASLHDGAREFRGRAIVVSILRELPDRRLLINVRARAAIDALTRREITVAREFASGKTYKEIAHALRTSPTTVRTQIQTIYIKLGVRTKVELTKHVAHLS